MVKLVRVCLAFVSIFTIANRCKAQPDYGYWAGVDLSKPLTKSLSISLSPELRLSDSNLHLDDFLVSAGIQFRILEWLKFELGYRYSRFYEADLDDRFNEHRYSVAFKPRFDFGRFTLTYRGLFQRSLIYWYSYGYSIETKDNFRNRLQINYNVPNIKIEPFVMGELYYDLTSGKQKEFNRLRVRVGASYPLNKRNEIEVFGQYQTKLNAKTSETSYVLGIFYSFSFRKSKPAASENVVVEEN